MFHESSKLPKARTGKEKHLAFVEEADVAQIRISLCDAGPGCAVMQLRLRDRPERIAVANGVLRGSARGSDRSRKDNLCACLNDVGIAKSGIKSEQFLPPASIAESRGGELPKRITGFDGDDRQFSRDRKRRRDASGRWRGIQARRWRRGDEHTR